MRISAHILAYLLFSSIFLATNSQGKDSEAIIKLDKEKLSRATDLHNRGAYDEAASILLDLIANNPNYYQPYYNLGVSLALKGDYLRSKKYLEQATLLLEKHRGLITQKLLML